MLTALSLRSFFTETLLRTVSIFANIPVTRPNTAEMTSEGASKLATFAMA